MKDLTQFIKESEFDNDEINQDPIEGGLDVALAGELFLYSERDEVFADRKLRMADAFKERLSMDEITADYISRTPIFKIYITHLKEGYRKDIDENMKINISTDDDLRRQVADSIVLLIKGVDF